MPLLLAPLRGVTVATFRREFVRHYGGFDAAVAPFIATVAGDRIRPALLRDVADPAAEAPMELIPQIIGKDPSHVAPMAAALRDLGYTRLNLNCGCPWKFVAKKGRGSGLLRDADALRRMLEAGCAAMPGGFSVKVRLGLADASLLAERIDVLNEFPLECVVVHPRTAAQMYEGEVDLDAFEALLPRFRAPVVYNGDIWTVADFLRLHARFPSVRGWMIGRGAVADPLLPQRIREALASRTMRPARRLCPTVETHGRGRSPSGPPLGPDVSDGTLTTDDFPSGRDVAASARNTPPCPCGASPLSERGRTKEKPPSERGVAAEPHSFLLPPSERGVAAEPPGGVLRAADKADEWLRLRHFHDALYAAYRAELFGPSPVLGRMKELWGYLARRLPDGAAHLRRIQRSATLDEFERHASAALDG